MTSEIINLFSPPQIKVVTSQPGSKTSMVGYQGPWKTSKRSSSFWPSTAWIEGNSEAAKSRAERIRIQEERREKAGKSTEEPNVSTWVFKIHCSEKVNQ